MFTKYNNNHLKQAQDEDIESDKTLEDGDAKPISEKAVQQLTSKVSFNVLLCVFLSTKSNK